MNDFDGDFWATFGTAHPPAKKLLETLKMFVQSLVNSREGAKAAFTSFYQFAKAKSYNFNFSRHDKFPPKFCPAKLRSSQKKRREKFFLICSYQVLVLLLFICCVYIY